MPRNSGAQALRFVPFAAASLTLAIVSVWGRMTMQRQWREWLSNHLYDYWLDNGLVIVRRNPCWNTTKIPNIGSLRYVRIATDLPDRSYTWVVLVISDRNHLYRRSLERRRRSCL